MAMTNTDKNLAIASMERVIQDACESAGVASLAAIETEVEGLRTAYDSDPSTVTDQQVGEAANKLEALTFPSTDDVSAVIDEAQDAVPE